MQPLMPEHSFPRDFHRREGYWVKKGRWNDVIEPIRDSSRDWQSFKNVISRCHNAFITYTRVPAISTFLKNDQRLSFEFFDVQN